MAVNKVIYGGNTVIDLTGDTVTPETLAEGSVAHDKSGAVIHGTMAVIKRTPYFYDDADGRWVDNSEGMISPDYPDMTCPICGAWLQSYMVINENPIDTFCPVCNRPITLIDGSVIERENTGSGVAYYFDVLDQMWWNNSDGVWGIPDYPSMSCPHCGVKLQASYEIDGNPQDTICPSCNNDIRLLDGQVLSTGTTRKWIFRNEVFPSMDTRTDLPGLEAGKSYTIVIDGVEGSTWWCEDGQMAWFYADKWENYMALDYNSFDGANNWTLLSEDYIGASISVYEYEE